MSTRPCLGLNAGFSHRTTALSIAVCLAAACGASAQCNFSSPPPVVDSPDTAFTDSNADGIDGMACGPIFVDTLSGSDTNPGTMALPMKSIGAAMLAAFQLTPKRDVYVSKGTYNERLCVLPGISIYAGFDAATGWSRSAANLTTVRSTTAPAAWAADQFNTGASTVAQVRFDTTSLLNAHPFNTSFIAADSSNTLQFVECQFASGGASGGGSGVLGPPGSSGGTGAAGNSGSCDSIIVASGGAGGTSSAGAPGGAGGRGGQGNGAGLAGNTAPSGGSGGAGGASGDPGTIGQSGSPGTNGTNGANGTAGSGFASSGAGASGGSGTVGDPGRGGGGGGGGGGQHCTFCNDGTGNGGGGGGGGGEGGIAGTGGNGGGSAFAFLADNVSNVSLFRCSFSTANAGNGGNGGVGGAGGSGGTGGAGGSLCTPEVGRGGAGGAGGSGGDGGHGGGGAGGSVAARAIANGAVVSVSSTLSTVLGTPGTGGAGSAGNSGATGGSYTGSVTLPGFTFTPPASPNLRAHVRLFGSLNSPTAPARVMVNRPNGSVLLPAAAAPVGYSFSSVFNGSASETPSGEIFFTPNVGFTGFTSFSFSSLLTGSGTAVVFIAPSTDCNGNGIEDATDIANATSQDCDANAIPDECVTPTATLITTHPANITPAINSSGVLAVAASGPGTLTFQWKKGLVNVSNGPRISGATSSVLTINPVITADAGTYTCVVTSSCASLTSNSATLTPICKPDYNADGSVSVQDIFDFLAGWFAGCP